jgi:hypothetical protein
MSVEAIRQTVGDQAEGGVPLLATGSEVPIDINSSGPNECGLEGASGNHLASKMDTWTQRPLMFEVSQAVQPADSGTQRIYELSSISCFNEQAMDLLSMNWMSPENSTSFGWNGLIAAPPYAEDDKSDPNMPFLFPASADLPDPGRECVLGNGQAPDIGRHGTSIDSAGHSTYAPSQLGSEESKSMIGSYYVDGDGSRAPFRGQASRQWKERRMTAVNDVSTPRSNVTNHTNGGTGSLWEGPLVSVDGYNNMIRELHLELGRKNAVIDANLFPSLQCIAACVQSYFTIFHPIFPFIRKRTFLEESNEHWIILLAVAVVGSKYTTSNEERLLSPKFIAILDGISSSRVCHHRPTETGIPSISPLRGVENNPFNLSTLQAATLSLICSLHGGKIDRTRHVLLKRHCLIGACTELNLLSGESEGGHHHQDYDKVIQDWSMNQSRIRTGLMIWVRPIKKEVHPPPQLTCL